MSLLGRRFSFQPARAARVERLDFRPLETRHVGLDREAGLGLQVGEMAISVRKAYQQIAIELDALRRIDGIHPIFLVDRLPQHQTPPSTALLQEIVEAPGAKHIAPDAVDRLPSP